MYHLFFFFAKVKTRRSPLHHQTRDALRPFASCPAHHDVDVSVSPSADEGLRAEQGEEKLAKAALAACCELEQPSSNLRAVEDVVVAFSLGRGQERRCITAAACSRKREGLIPGKILFKMDFFTRNLESELAKTKFHLFHLFEMSVQINDCKSALYDDMKSTGIRGAKSIFLLLFYSKTSF